MSKYLTLEHVRTVIDSLIKEGEANIEARLRNETPVETDTTKLPGKDSHIDRYIRAARERTTYLEGFTRGLREAIDTLERRAKQYHSEALKDLDNTLTEALKRITVLEADKWKPAIL